MKIRIAQVGISTLIAVFGIVGGVAAHDLSVNLGSLATDHSKTTYSWQLDYRMNFEHNLAWSISWINEGHTYRHFQDGYASQVWEGLPFFKKRLILSLGIGMERYFNTEPMPNDGAANSHGWVPIYSAVAIYNTNSNWFYRLTFNRIGPSANFLNSNSLMAGVGYKLWKYSRPEETPTPTESTETDVIPTGFEVTAYSGKTVVNDFNSHSGIAYELEFRKGIVPYIDWSLSWIEEGAILHRHGPAAQLWLMDSFLNDHFSLGFGFGGYNNFDDPNTSLRGPFAHTEFSGIVTPTIGVRFSDHWLARLSWNRIVSSDDRDTDIFLFGLGYRWNKFPWVK